MATLLLLEQGELFRQRSTDTGGRLLTRRIVESTATTRFRSSPVSARATSTLNVRSQEPSAAHIRGRSQSFLRLAYFSPRAHWLLPSGSPGDQFGRVCGEDGLPGGDPSVPVGTGAQQPVQ